MRRKYIGLPITNKKPQKGDYWLASFPFHEAGNFEKLRPIFVEQVNQEDKSIVARMITTNPKYGEKINDKKHFKKDSYLTNNRATLPYDKLFRRIKSFQDRT